MDQRRCPHPHGTREYEDWWRLEHARIAEAAGRLRATEDQQRHEMEVHRYGHLLHNRERRCPCGMTAERYHSLTPEERWRDRESFRCRR